MPQRPRQIAFQLHVSLQGVEPLVWRRLLVPGRTRLSTLHDILQVAMGWENSHLHVFHIGTARYGPCYDDAPSDELDEFEVSVAQALKGQERFRYEYDFGDGWEHEVTIEARTETPVGLKFAVCLGGGNACPPEDCGGPAGYAAMLEALADSSHEDRDQYLAWLGGDFDRAAFDVAAVNVALQHALPSPRVS
jgi:hypothetical protein